LRPLLQAMLLGLSACGREPADVPQFAVIAADSGAQEEPVFSPCPRAEPCRILPLGDSITYGVGYSGGYRVELFREALAAGKSLTFVGSQRNGPETIDEVRFPRHHEGHGGYRIDQLMPLVPWLALDGTPHIVLLMAGTNDIGQDHDLATAPERLGELVDALTEVAPDALIVVAKTTPLKIGVDQVLRYNDALEGVIEARAAQEKHVQLVDMFAGFPDSELADNVHPGARGYERMAGIWYTAISDYLR
jgi:lysophospholipase L1-like esterase